MSTTTIDILEAQPQLSELLQLAAAGDEVIIVEGEKLLARLMPLGSSPKKRIAGLDSGARWTSDDYDDPLPDEFWAGTA